MPRVTEPTRDKAELNLGLHSPLLHTAGIDHGLTMISTGPHNKQVEIGSICPCDRGIHRKKKGAVCPGSQG